MDRSIETTRRIGGRTWWGRLLALAGVVLLLAGCASVAAPSGEVREKRENVLAQDIAQAIMEKNLRAPATAQWVSREVIEKDGYGRYLIKVVVDAQNGFGALIRGNYLVAFRITDVEKGAYSYLPKASVQEIGTEADGLPGWDRATMVNLTADFLKELNNWGEAPEE